MNAHRGLAVVLTTLCFVLPAGCAGPAAGPSAGPGGSVSSGAVMPVSPDGGSGASAPPSSTTGSAGSARPAPTGRGPLPPAPSGPSGSMTLHGVVYAGVEPNCLLLNQGGTSYLLLGGDRTLLRDGSTVTVQGTIAKGVMTTCMQGTPFQVSQVRPG